MRDQIRISLSFFNDSYHFYHPLTDHCMALSVSSNAILYSTSIERFIVLYALYHILPKKRFPTDRSTRRAMSTPPNTKTLCTILCATAILSACDKDEDTPAPPMAAPVSTNTTLLVEHHVDDAPLVYDVVAFTNAAGHQYSVSRLQYYLSELTLLGSNGTPDHTITGPFYINGTATNSFDLGTLPVGSYSGATMLLGLPPALNLTGALPSLIENINLAWPEPMGGGYHFMKFEGHFLDAGTPTGFAMHIGRNENLPTCAMAQSIAFNGNAGKLVLRFNLNEVFRTPNTYDLSTGNYSMGSMMLMALLRDNCADAFTMETRP